MTAVGPGKNPLASRLHSLTCVFRKYLRKFDVPTLVLHGQDDQIVPVKDSAHKSARIIKHAKELYYPRAPHGLTATHQDRVNADLLSFLLRETLADSGNLPAG
ncbi:MAG TPA: alpha/beta hydrolase [Blastocatellia bacterium]|nr:alpha/beta hydrolase [Blastocatellia bacterium]